MTKAVLDASALLALLNGEPGAEKVAEALPDALVSTVNYAEVVAKLVERGGAPEQIDAALRWVAVMTVDFDIDLARRAGALRAATAKLGLSLGDRACLALAQREGAPAYTADRHWRGAVSGVDIRLIR